MERKEMNKKSLIVSFLLILVILLLGTVYTVTNIQKNYPSKGSIKTVGIEVYIDSTKNNILTEINWGILEPNQIVTYNAYIVSISNSPINLFLSTTNWNPSNAEPYITLSWNYTGVVLQPNDEIPIIFTLQISPDTTEIDNFSFDIIIMVSG